MLAEWCCQEACGTASVRKLWLFDNRLGDEGAVQVARILEKHPGMVEVCPSTASRGVCCCRLASAVVAGKIRAAISTLLPRLMIAASTRRCICRTT